MTKVITSRQPGIVDIEIWLNGLEGKVIHFQILPVAIGAKTVYDIIALVELD